MALTIENADDAEALITLMVEARASHADELLGYESWNSYIRELLKGTVYRLDRDVWQDLVGESLRLGATRELIEDLHRLGGWQEILRRSGWV